MPLTLLLVTDIHDRIRYADKLVKDAQDKNISIDAVIIAGDLTYFRRAEHAIKILEEFAVKLDKPIYFVPGNCDDPRLLDIDELKERRIYNIHGRKRIIKDYVIYGIGGSNFTPFNTLIEWGEEEIERFVSMVIDVDSKKLIMVTHVPIYGVMDIVGGENVGSSVLRKFLNDHGALLWVTGHLHEYSGYKIVNGTIVVNPGPFMMGYYGIANISDSTVNVWINNFLYSK
ncbi:metallophosphoesterase [Staphylothermus hellenicus]|uniref:metallophosphoesterase n=1 Tax=Staphylothermus hellenicus TaxID=84599 RepID=UPI0011E50613|nr:metallophosphoesterase [Staphylothermus hellenicus]